MDKVVLDAATVVKLRDVRQEAALYDETGHVVGHFRPASPFPPGNFPEAPVSDVELNRIEQEEHGRGRPLADILADLERRK
jgi:hypothetical protein